MNVLDVGVVVLVVAAAWGGFQIGFLARALSWAGMLVGLVVGARVATVIVDALRDPPPGVATMIGLGVILVGSLAGQVVGLMVGTRARDRLGGSELPRLDRIGGAFVAGLGVFVVVWLMLPTLAAGTTWIGRLARESGSYESFPRPPDALRVLRDVIEPEAVTRVVNLSDADVGDPPIGHGLPDGIVASVSRSVVRVQTRACGNVQTGSGFVVGDSLVVTNAHVVAGSSAPEVVRDDGEAFTASVVAFDAGRDVAVLVVPGLDRPALMRSSIGDGAIGGVFGHPGGEELTISAFRVERELVATGNDLYGSVAQPRQVLLVASSLEPGDSGAPLVDATGRVVGLTFAVAPGDEAVAYALTVDEIESVLAAIADGVAQDVVGPCLTEEPGP